MRLSHRHAGGGVQVLRITMSDDDEAVYYFSDGAQLHATADDMALFGPDGVMLTSAGGMQDIEDSPYKAAADAADLAMEPQPMTGREQRGLLKGPIPVGRRPQ